LNEKIIELTISAIDFWGTNGSHLQTLKKMYPKLKIVVRGNLIKAFGEQEILDEFEKQLNRLVDYFLRYNRMDHNVIERIVQGDEIDEKTDRKKDVLLHGVGGKLIKAITPNQQKLVDLIEKNDMVFAVGPAGTGKTYTGVAMAVKTLKEKKIKRIILTRPAVEAGENLGFLPGDMKEKLDPYMQPLYDALVDMIPFERLDDYIQKGIIQIAPLAFMRGRTLDNAFVILDEAQNTTHAQMKMFLTRMGKNAKFMITGDPGQIDLPRRAISGLKEALLILKDIEGIGTVFLDDKDVVRHRLVQRIIMAYKNIENQD